MEKIHVKSQDLKKVIEILLVLQCNCRWHCEILMFL
jgi:hypothetical protein